MFQNQPTADLLHRYQQAARDATHLLLNPCADGRYRQWFQIIEVREDNTYAIEYGLIGAEYDPRRYGD